jgi:hypothetical protein
MRKPIFILLFIVLTAFISGCGNDDEVKQISKEGAIETMISVDHLDANHDILITTHNVWVKNVLTKRVVYKDTIPTLANTPQEAENGTGTTETKAAILKKDYEVYITVK